MHCGGGADHRMAREWEFFLSREDSGWDDIAIRFEVEEDRFELPHLPRDGQQFVSGEPSSSENDHQPVAAVRPVGEDIDVAVVQARIHAQPLSREGRSVSRESKGGGGEETRRVRTRNVKINRAVPNIRSDRPAETRDFFVELLGFETVMDLGWVATVASPNDATAQVNIIGNDDPAAPGISVEVDDVDAVHARAIERGLEIAYPLRDEEWGVRRFMLREPSGTVVNVLSHRSTDQSSAAVVA